MAIGCSARCAKAVLITFNLIFWFSGCALLALGVWLLLDPVKAYMFQLVATAAEEAGDEIRHYLAYALIGLGGLILIVGFFGCCGALQESKWMLVMYFIFLFLIFCAELGIAALPLLYRDKFMEGLETALSKKLQTQYAQEKQQAFTTAVDYVQYKLECCGFRDQQDYRNSKWLNASMKQNEKLEVPLTCCRLEEEPDDLNNNNMQNRQRSTPWSDPKPMDRESCQAPELRDYTMHRHDTGCLEKLKGWFMLESNCLIVGAIGVAALEVLGMIFAMCLCRNIGEEI